MPASAGSASRVGSSRLAPARLGPARGCRRLGSGVVLARNSPFHVKRGTARCGAHAAGRYLSRRHSSASRCNPQLGADAAGGLPHASADSCSSLGPGLRARMFHVERPCARRRDPIKPDSAQPHPRVIARQSQGSGPATSRVDQRDALDITPAVSRETRIALPCRLQLDPSCVSLSYRRVTGYEQQAASPASGQQKARGRWPR